MANLVDGNTNEVERTSSDAVGLIEVKIEIAVKRNRCVAGRCIGSCQTKRFCVRRGNPNLGVVGAAIVIDVRSFVACAAGFVCLIGVDRERRTGGKIGGKD